MARRKARPAFVTYFATRVRLYAAVAIGLLCYGLLSFSVIAGGLADSPLKPALAWMATVIAYLIPTLMMIHNPDKGRIRQRAKAIDMSLWEIVAGILLASAFSLFAVAGVILGAKVLSGAEHAIHLGIGILTIVLSWFMLHVIYAVHYAHVYYDPAERKDSNLRGGVAFPQTKEPDYWDFVYFSFVIGMTCQVSDVPVTERHFRHLVSAHGIISFFYNTVVVALAVNIAAGSS
jgi:uncharacterized membrane protein